MGGIRLEVFKFTLYLIVPIITLLEFGNPQWYRNNVVPYREKLFPSDDQTNRRIPTDKNGVKEELARMQAQKAVMKLERERQISAGDSESARLAEH